MSLPQQIDSLDELRAQEKDLLARIAAWPNGGRLFLCDPARLLSEFGVTLGPSTRTAWAQLLNDESVLDGDKVGLFEAIRASRPTGGAGEVRIRGLLPPSLKRGRSS